MHTPRANPGEDDEKEEEREEEDGENFILSSSGMSQPNITVITLTQRGQDTWKRGMTRCWGRGGANGPTPWHRG